MPKRRVMMRVEKLTADLWRISEDSTVIWWGAMAVAGLGLVALNPAIEMLKKGDCLVPLALGGLVAGGILYGCRRMYGAYHEAKSVGRLLDDELDK